MARTNRPSASSADGIPTPPSDPEHVVSLHAGWEVDGQVVDAYLARPMGGGSRPGVILVAGMFGLSSRQRELTRRYARAGFVALSPDYLHGQRPQTKAEGLLAKNSVDVDVAVRQIAAGADFLRTLPGVGPDGRIGILGFCLGGGIALFVLAKHNRFQAGVIYHHSLYPDPRALESIQAPLLGHYGTRDDTTPRVEVDAFTAALDRYGKRYELHWYEGMGHSFAEALPDADSKDELPAHQPMVPFKPAQRAAENLSHDRSIEFLWRELGTSPGAKDDGDEARLE